MRRRDSTKVTGDKDKMKIWQRAPISEKGKGPMRGHKENNTLLFIKFQLYFGLVSNQEDVK